MATTLSLGPMHQPHNEDVDDDDSMEFNADAIGDRLKNFDEFNDSIMKTMIDSDNSEDEKSGSGNSSRKKMARKRSSKKVVHPVADDNDDIYYDSETPERIMVPSKKNDGRRETFNQDGALEKLLSASMRFNEDFSHSDSGSLASESQMSTSGGKSAEKRRGRKATSERSSHRSDDKSRSRAKSGSNERGSSRKSDAKANSIASKDRGSTRPRPAASASPQRRSSGKVRPSNKPRRTRSDMYGSKRASLHRRTTQRSRSPSQSGRSIASTRTRSRSRSISGMSPDRAASIAGLESSSVQGPQKPRRGLKRGSSVGSGLGTLERQLAMLGGANSQECSSVAAPRRRLKQQPDPFCSATVSGDGVNIDASRRRHLRNDPLRRSIDISDLQRDSQRQQDPLDGSNHSGTGAASRRKSFSSEIQRKMNKEEPSLHNQTRQPQAGAADRRRQLSKERSLRGFRESFHDSFSGELQKESRRPQSVDADRRRQLSKAHSLRDFNESFNNSFSGEPQMDSRRPQSIDADRRRQLSKARSLRDFNGSSNNSSSRGISNGSNRPQSIGPDRRQQLSKTRSLRDFNESFNNSFSGDFPSDWILPRSLEGDRRCQLSKEDSLRDFNDSFNNSFYGTRGDQKVRRGRKPTRSRSASGDLLPVPTGSPRRVRSKSYTMDRDSVS